MKIQKDLSGKTIMVVDDEEIVIKYFNEVLKDLKVNIIVAVNGKEAVDIYKRKGNVDLILLDLKMPIMNGFTCLKELLEIDSYVKAIAQTAFVTQSEQEKCLAAGFIDYIEKPVIKDELLDKIMKWI